MPLADVFPRPVRSSSARQDLQRIRRELGRLQRGNAFPIECGGVSSLRSRDALQLRRIQYEPQSASGEPDLSGTQRSCESLLASRQRSPLCERQVGAPGKAADDFGTMFAPCRGWDGATRSGYAMPVCGSYRPHVSGGRAAWALSRTLTATCHSAVLPSVLQYRRATPTACSSCLRKLVSSRISTASVDRRSKSYVVAVAGGGAKQYGLLSMNRRVAAAHACRRPARALRSAKSSCARLFARPAHVFALIGSALNAPKQLGVFFVHSSWPSFGRAKLRRPNALR